jgi:hypothetical protein
MGGEHEYRPAAVLGVADRDPALDEGDLDAPVGGTQAALTPRCAGQIHVISSME